MAHISSQFIFHMHTDTRKRQGNLWNEEVKLEGKLLQRNKKKIYRVCLVPRNLLTRQLLKLPGCLATTNYFI